MPDQFLDVDVRGLAQLDRNLARLPNAAGFKALRGGLMKASLPMLKAAKANALSTGIRGRDAGATAAAMGRWTRKVNETTTELFIGPRNRNKKALALWNEANPAPRAATRLTHFHLLEFGSIHGPAQPFLQPAFNATKTIVVQRFAGALRASIAREVAKLEKTPRR